MGANARTHMCPCRPGAATRRPTKRLRALNLALAFGVRCFPPLLSNVTNHASISLQTQLNKPHALLITPHLQCNSPTCSQAAMRSGKDEFHLVPFFRRLFGERGGTRWNASHQTCLRLWRAVLSAVMKFLGAIVQGNLTADCTDERRWEELKDSEPFPSRISLYQVKSAPSAYVRPASTRSGAI